MTVEPWTIQWYECLADPNDVAFAKSNGNNIKVGDPLWRVPYAIGPIGTDHNHWAGGHLTGDDEAIAMARAAPVMLEALRKAEQFITNGVEGGYIRLPEPGDSALETLPVIRAAIKLATEMS